MTHHPHDSRRPLAPARRTRPAGLTLAALLVAAATTASCGPETLAAAGGDADVWQVQRGKRRVSLKENAELAAARETRVRSEMEGQNTVIWLIPEGTRVDQGDRLVELDASQVIERKASQEITVARAFASWISAQKSLEIQIKQNEADELAAQNNLKIALMEQEKFFGRAAAEEGLRQMGEREQKEKDAQDNIRLAEQELKLAEDRMMWSERLAAKDYITKNELERDTVEADRKRYQLQRARNTLHLLQEYDLRIEELGVAQKVREAELALERVKAQGEARKAQAEAEEKSRADEYNLAKERLDNLNRQIDNAVIKAPTPGLAVYAFEGDGFRRREVVEEGSSVRERQGLIILPDITRMIAKLSVHEAMIDKVSVGQPAFVRVDAFPDRVFPGRVVSVSALADSNSRMSNPNAKLYKTTVELEGPNDVLRPNMSASCEIVLAELNDVLFVPVQAIHRQGRVPYVWAVTPKGPQARPVKLGINDYSFVVIDDGVTDGDRLLLAAPAGVQAPEFPQPQDPVVPVATTEPAVAGEGDAAAQGASARRRGAGNSQMTEFRELFAKKFPELAARVEEDRSLMRSDEYRQAIDGDPELKAMWDQMMTRFQGMGGRGGRRGGEDGNSGGADGERGGGRRRGGDGAAPGNGGGSEQGGGRRRGGDAGNR